MRTEDPIDLTPVGAPSDDDSLGRVLRNFEDRDIAVARHDPVATAVGGDDDQDGDGSTADPGGDSDPDANEGFEPPSD